MDTGRSSGGKWIGLVVVDVEILNGDDPSISHAFREVIGLEVSNIDQCATAAGVAAGEVLRAIGTP